MTDQREERRIDREIHRVSNGSDPFAAAVRATRMPMLITDPRQPDNPIIFVNDAFRRLTGYTREETLGRNCRFLQGEATERAKVDQIRDSIARRVPIETELLNYRKDGSTFWNRLLISPVFDGDDLTHYFASQFDVTHEKRRITTLETDRSALELELERRVFELTATEERLRYTLQAGKLGTWMLDLDSGRLVSSALMKSIFDVGPADSFSYDDWLSRIIPADRARWEKAIAAAIAEGGDLDTEFRIAMPHDQVRWLEARGKVTTRADGTPLGVAGVALDITTRKVAEGHRDLLTRELDHRVKNTLANVQSLVHQSLAEASTLTAANALVSARLGALAGAHDVLTRQGWERAPLSEVVDTALAPFRNRDPRRFRLGGPEIYLQARAVTAFSIALHELATNAVKYGALSNDTGFVILNWSIEDEELRLCWEEEGGPPVSQPTRTGFGTRVIERALALELNGRGRLVYRPKGLMFELKAPLGEMADDTPEPAKRDPSRPFS